MKRTYIFRIKLQQILDERGMTQAELAEVTGLRPAAISEFAKGSRTVINKSHLGKIMDALDIKKIEDIVEIVIEEEF